MIKMTAVSFVLSGRPGMILTAVKTRAWSRRVD
jgi:hypothetical protein